MATSTKKKQQLEKIRCNECTNETQHRLLKTVVEEEHEAYPEDNFTIDWRITHEVFQCCGCNSVVLRRTHEHSEWEYPEVRYFPPAVSRKQPDWSLKIPAEMYLVLIEIYNSLDADNRALPMMGARTLLDLLIVDKVGDTGTFVEKLKALETEGYISRKNREILEVALDAGSAAAHRGYKPRLEHVNSVMDIVENLLHATYVLEEIANEVKKATPPKPPKAKKTSA